MPQKTLKVRIFPVQRLLCRNKIIFMTCTLLLWSFWPLSSINKPLIKMLKGHPMTSFWLLFTFWILATRRHLV